MKNITKNYTLYKFEELGEAAKERIRLSMYPDVRDWNQSGIEEEFSNLFDRFNYGDSYKKCELIPFCEGGGAIVGNLQPYDVWEAVSEHHADEELIKEMEMVLTMTNGVDIDVKFYDVYVYGESHIDTLLQYNAETDEEKEALNERLNKSISRLEEIILEDFKKMTEEFIMISQSLEEFHYSDAFIDEMIEGQYEDKECFLKDGTLFE